jgi:hypothetical protein
VCCINSQKANQHPDNNNNNNNNNNNKTSEKRRRNNNNRNVIQKESEKKLKYKNLSIEIQRMWNMKCFVKLVFIRATGIVTTGLKKICKQYQESIQ